MLSRGMGVYEIVTAEFALHSQIAELAGASELAGLGAIAAGALPVFAMEGVFLALGAGYLEAREIVRERESRSGFSHGFVMGILGWEWRHVLDRFYRHYIHISSWDEELNVIRVKAYNVSLQSGFLLGAVLPDSLQKAFVSGLRKLAGHPSTANWNSRDPLDEMEVYRAQRVQINFVIDLAVAFQRRSLR